MHRARKAVVLVDEAYYEFSGVTALTEIERVPNLFVCRTFSKVFGMAAMRLGCLFSHEANIAVSAQSAVALQRERAGGRGRRRPPWKIPPISKTTSPKCWPRANCSASAWKSLASPTFPVPANFVLGNFGNRAIEVRDALRGQAILVRDRSYEAPGCVRITVGTREQTRRLWRLEEIWNR